MYPISPLFADYLHRPGREFYVKAEIGTETYDNADIIDFSIENSLINGDEFEIGTTVLSKLTITLRLKTEVLANARIVPYLALSTAGLTWEEATYPWNSMNVPWIGGGTEWLPLGEFFIDTRERINDVWTFTCYDKLYWADVPYVSSLTFPTTQKAVWDEICSRLGYTYDNSVVINSSYKLNAVPAGYSMRQVLGFIASANTASIFVGKDGKIKFKRYRVGSSADFEMKVSDYIRVKQTNPLKTYTRVVVTYNTEDKLTYEAGTGDENHTLYIENPLATQAITNSIQAAINGFTYLPIEMDSKGYPHLEVGDLLGFDQQESVSWLDAITTWDSTNIPWDGIMHYQSPILKMTMSFKGGLKMQITSPSKSEQQSEFVVEGSLTQQISKLNKDAVKEGKPYYGASITRTEGLVIDRTDGLSKAVFNSDELSFYANGQRALWFDVPNRKFKFTGTLEGVDGEFSGSLKAATGTFTGELKAASGTFSGRLEAASGSFSGEITASTIRGGTIIGSTIKTAMSGRRIELDVSGFRSYDSSGGKRISIDAGDGIDVGGMMFYGPSGQWAGQIAGSDGYYQLLAYQNMQFAALQGQISFQGNVNFSTANVSGLSYAEINGLVDKLDSKADTSKAGYNLAFDTVTRNLKMYSQSGNLLAQVTIP